jgi:hypothetical protein
LVDFCGIILDIIPLDILPTYPNGPAGGHTIRELQDGQGRQDVLCFVQCEIDDQLSAEPSVTIDYTLGLVVTGSYGAFCFR